MTLKDIAFECKVSVSTVSRVLNGNIDNAASKELSEQIRQVAKKGGYISNKYAVSLKAGQNKPVRTIYCLVACSAKEVNGDPFFTTAIAAVEKEAKKQNCLMDYTFYAGEVEGNDITKLMEKGNDGMLLIIGRFKEQLYRRLAQGFKSIIYLAWNDLGIDCDCVLCDGFLAGRYAVDYLYGLGHRKIGFIGTSANEARFKGVTSRLNELGLFLDEKNIITNQFLSFEIGRNGLAQLIENNFDASAIYCANDTVAIGVLAECKERGIRVPEDISILGTNDTEIAQYATPMISSIKIPLKEMGRMATMMLLDRADKGHKLALKVIFPFKLTERDSCRNINDDE